MSAAQDYASFLVRLWRQQAADREWTVQVEHIPTGEKRYFSTLDELFAFIRGQLPAPTARDAAAPGSPIP
ncbi:MAG: hypothetical protein HY675_23495 [Chloroflexi bacterium]|nr:hypothetical protein [Chloroflexota bacterium]